MAEEGTPPTEPIEPGVEPTEPIEPLEPIEPVEPVEPPSEPPVKLSDEELIDKAFQKTASWLGRRDQDLLTNIGDMVEQKIGKTNPELAPASPETVFDNPDQWFQDKYSQAQQRHTQEQVDYNKTMFKSAGSVMDNDALFADKELGTEVIEEVKKISSQVDRRIPADAAGNMLVKEALVNVYRKRAEVKVNPLNKNTPTKTPLGTVTPPTPTQPKVKLRKISDMATGLAKRFGYKEEDLKRVFKE